MPEVSVTIGGRVFQVACQEGEQPFLEAAARMLDIEAAAMSDHMGRMPEARMLLMAGLMLADKTAELEKQVTAMAEEIDALEARLQEVDGQPSTVAVVPEAVRDSLLELAAQAEALAQQMETPAA